MKTSDVVQYLVKLIAQHGDREFRVNGLPVTFIGAVLEERYSGEVDYYNVTGHTVVDMGDST